MNEFLVSLIVLFVIVFVISIVIPVLLILWSKYILGPIFNYLNGVFDNE